MKQGQGVGMRPLAIDRNAAWEELNVVLENIGAHAVTVRASYTIPAARKAIIRSARSLVQVRTVGVVGDKAGAIIQVYSGIAPILRHPAIVRGWLAADSDSVTMVDPLDLTAAQRIDLVTYSTGAGLFSDFYMSVSIMTYDP